MSIFGKKNGVRSLEEDLFQLLKRVDILESQAKIGKLEAAEIYDKTLRLMQRMAKRYEVDMRENGTSTPSLPETSPSDGLDPISRSIMMRRSRQVTSE